MNISYTNKTVVVTGGASGIGQAVAKTFALNGASVFIIDIEESELNKTVNEIQSKGGKVKGLVCDISNVGLVEKVFGKIKESVSTIDVLINNAGIAHVGNLENTSEEDFDRIFSVNVKGMFNCSKAVIPVMKKQKGGAILNLASIVASIGVPDRFAYSMSKGAVVGMTKSIACDYVDDNIRCNCISPGRVHTPFVDNFIAKNYPGKEKEMFETLSQTQPIGRMGKPEEIAHLCLYLCSDEAAFITGNDYPIDGGFLSLKK